MLFTSIKRATLAASLLTLSAEPCPSQEWPHYGGDAGGLKYSRLDQINKRNVTQFEVAWTFDTEEVRTGKEYPTHSAFEATSIVVDGVMYVTSPFAHLFALDPETGKKLWDFDPKVDRTLRLNLFINRGVPTGATARANDLLGRSTRPPVLDRRGNRKARRELRARRHPRPGKGHGRRFPGRQMRLDLTGCRVRRHGRRRWIGQRRQAPRPCRRYPRIRRRNRQSAVAFPHGAPSRRIRPRHLGSRILEGPRRDERVVGHERGHGKQPRFRAPRIGVLRFLRRRPQRRESLQRWT